MLEYPSTGPWSVLLSGPHNSYSKAQVSIMLCLPQSQFTFPTCDFASHCRQKAEWI